jgi:hypothetical protein
MKSIKCPQCGNVSHIYRADNRNWITCSACGFTLPVSAIQGYIKGRKKRDNELELLSKKISYVKNNKTPNNV